MRHGHCKTPLDLFGLTEESLASLNLGSEDAPRRFGGKNAVKVLAALRAARSKPLQRWLYAMGIRQLGEAAARELARIHRTLTELVDSPVLAEILRDTRADAKKKNDLLAPYAISGDVGPAVAETLAAFFRSDAGRAVLARLSQLGIDPVSDRYHPHAAAVDMASLPLVGMTFVITGTLSLERDMMKALIESKGGKVSNSISARTAYLLVGEGGGSKRATAEKLGVPIIDEQELARLLE